MVGDGSVLVTGPTGNVGSAVVASLLELGQRVTAGVFNEAEAERLDPHPLLETRIFKFGETNTYGPAFDGATKLFLMRPPQIADVKRYLFPVVDYAVAAGIDQIAFLSLLGVERNRVVPHYKVEKYLERCGISYTFVRPSFYMQNLSTTHRAEIRDDNVIAVPVGKAKTSFIDARDVGAVAARVLVESGHDNRAYPLTGAEALDYYRVAELFTEVLGRKITYTNPSIPAFVRRSRRQGVPMKFALVMVGLYTATRMGSGEAVTDDVERLLGRPPMTMRRYIEDHSGYW